MREITKIMVKKYALNKLKYDFMAYPFENTKHLSFHHLILSHQYCKQNGLGEGYWEWNGAILVQHTSHEYLHLIQYYNPDIFNAITSEMTDMNIKGFLDIENLKYIDSALKSFEKEHCGTRNKKGHLVIKPEYTRRLIKNG